MSRWDSYGRAWNEAPREKKQGGGSVSSVRPQIPDTGWTCPDLNSVNLRNAKMIGLDIETKDPNLREKGPGPRRRKEEGGFIAGLAVSVGPGDGEQWYFPMNHEDGKSNLDPDMVMLWAQDNLCNPYQPKIGAKLDYDLDWLAEMGVRVTGPFVDVQIAAPLIDENAFSYSLEALSAKYAVGEKEDDLLHEWLAAVFGGKPTRNDQAARYWRAPAELVGPYAMSDVRLPFLIWEEQQKTLSRENLWDVYKVEQRLIPLLLAMRRRGVKADIEKAHAVDEELIRRAKDYRQELDASGVDPWSNDTLAPYCDERGIKYKKTAIGNPSFPGAWLEQQTDPMLKLVYEVRRLEKHAGTFVEGTVLSNAVDGRIHCQFNQLRSDDFGAVSGRFSSSNPNLQNIPARDEELGPLIRSLFIADPGEVWWSADWSQIEFRLLVHYAASRGYESAIKTAQRYHADPTTDFHRYVAEIAQIERGPAKNINFGLVYGMGKPKLAASLGRSIDECEPIFNQYHSNLPFIKKIYDELNNRATDTGFIFTLLRRRRRFNLWEPRSWDEKKNANHRALPYEKALEKWGRRIQRAGGHKALNSLLQGGAADIMKLAMADIWDAGICDALGIPLLTVHDELNWSFDDTPQNAKAYQESLDIMENCIELELPLKVDTGRGANWGEAK